MSWAYHAERFQLWDASVFTKPWLPAGPSPSARVWFCWGSPALGRWRAQTSEPESLTSPNSSVLEETKPGGKCAYNPMEIKIG
jgi:hypothetical protein